MLDIRLSANKMKYTAHQVGQLLSWTSCLASCTKGLELDSGHKPEAEKGISSINFYFRLRKPDQHDRV
ncbi:hypothetical protein B0H17DRAFT_1065921 [Mycena rosella]|uniref:Uncharacterized protein n=1 Tax=Mycena rosella TaxID=1033263 RepID=A0AAD7DF35_MYCRO|nr:hypothetical protein B0H17DRAFT_1065921 [Mycena rosella]